MYEVTINHNKGKNPKVYTVYRKEEAEKDEIDYVYWKDAKIGEYALSDDEYVAKVINKVEYPGNRGFHNVYIRFPWGYTFFNTKYTGKKLLAKGRRTNTTFTGKPWHEVKCNSDKFKNLALSYITSNYNADLAIDITFGAVTPSERRRYKRTIRTEAFKNMMKEELSNLLSERGLTEGYTLELLEETISLAKDKKDITNLMRAVDNLQDMHGMKDKHLVKTTEKLEATNTKLIDELREEEVKLVATKTTVEEKDSE
tara:strand:+ start:153 stop:920 length:768 start_codon:yes stop_codon:yes gene_type:complete